MTKLVIADLISKLESVKSDCDNYEVWDVFDQDNWESMSNLLNYVITELRKVSND